MAKKTRPSIRSRISAFKQERITLFALVLFALLLPIVVFAQTQTVRTKVGNPREGDTVRIGRDLKTAYDICNSGYTYENADGNLGPCLSEQLKTLGYDDNAIKLFESIRPNTLYSQDVEPRPCTQCLGFVRLILALETGDPYILGFGAAATVAGLSSFSSVDGQTWTRVPDEADLLPGDIGAHAKSTFGHILIVLTADGARFTALESNGQYPTVACRVTDDLQRIRDGLVFFRKI